MSETAPQATVVIVTKNRKDDLRRALTSTYTQSDVTFDVIVFDDASTDGTPDIVRAEFPQARLHVAEVSTGHIVHRNRGTELAQLDRRDHRRRFGLRIARYAGSEHRGV